MGTLLKYILSSSIILSIFCSCDKFPLENRLEYNYTKEELEVVKERIEKELRFLYDGSKIKQTKLDTLIAINPENERYYRQKSHSLTRMGDFNLGYPLMQKAVKLDPLNALYFTSWELLYVFRDYERALDELNYYDDISDGVDYIRGENIHFLKGMAHKQMKQYDLAVQEFDKAIRHDKRSADIYVYVYRGIANLRNGCLAQAIEDFDKAIKENPKCTMAIVYKAEALIRNEESERAIEYLLKAKDLLSRGVKLTQPFGEVFDEVHMIQVEELLAQTGEIVS